MLDRESFDGISSETLTPVNMVGQPLSPEQIAFRETMASLTIQPSRRDYRREAIEYCLNQGYQPHRLAAGEVDLRKIKEGDDITCADYRHDDTHNPGPAFFGGAHGLLTLTDPILPIEVRYAVLDENLKAERLNPGDHGLGKHYPVPDCAFLKAVLGGKIPTLEDLSHEQIVFARQRHMIRHRILGRPKTHPDTAVFNFTEDQKVIPYGKYYVVDMGRFVPLAQGLGKDLVDMLRLSIHVMRLVNADKVMVV